MARERDPAKCTTRWPSMSFITTSNKTSPASNTTASTAARHRVSVLSHLGPWPLKRSFSEHDCGYTYPDAVTPGDEAHTTQTHPTLAEVLAKIDEECKAVDRALEVEAAYRNKFEESDEQTLCEEKLQVNERAVKALTILLAAAAIPIFVSAPVVTFVFAQTARGGIVLQKEAASKAALGVILAILAMAIGMVSAGAIAGAVAAHKGQILLTGKTVGMIVAVGFMIGAVLTGWVLAWILPLTSHA